MQTYQEMLVGGMIFAGAQPFVLPMVCLIMFNRYLTFVRNGFAGIPTLCEEKMPREYYAELANTSDIL